MKKIILIILIIQITLSASLQKVSLQLEWKHQFEFAGFYAALQKGYYKSIGLDVKIQEYKNGTDVTQNVLNQNSTFGLSSSSLIIKKLQHKPVVLLASYFKSNTLALLTKPDIKSVKDLKGKRIMALASEMKQTSLALMLKENNIKENDYTLVKDDFKIDKFINGEIDAMSIFTTNQPFLLDKKNIKYNIINPSLYGIYSYDVELFTSQDIAKKYPIMVKNFIDATAKGWKYAFANKEEIIDLIYNKYSKRKSKEALRYEAQKTEEVFRRNIFKIGAIAPELVKLNAQIFQKLHISKDNIDINDFLSSYIFNPYKNYKIKFNDKEQAYLKKKREIHICVDPNWMPFEALIDNKYTGMSADYFKIFKNELQLPIILTKTDSWSQSLEFVKQKKCDLLPLAIKTKKREKFLNFTSPYLSEPLVLVTKINTAFVSDFKSLKNKKIGLVKNYGYKEVLKKQYPNLEIIDVNTIEDGLNKVRSGELYGYAGILPVAAYQLQKNLTGELKIAGKFNNNFEFSIATRDDDTMLLKIFQKAINSLTLEDKQKILNKWVSVKYEKGIDYTILLQAMGVFILILIVFSYWNRKLSKLNKELQIANEKSEAATKEKANFLSNMSHEIRTPMNAIVGMTYLVKQTSLNQTQKEYLDKIELASNNLLKLINDILDFSKADAGKITLESIDFNILELLNPIENIASIQAIEKNLKFEIDYDKKEISNLKGDLTKLKQILTNLVSNAIKFTKEGSVSLTVTKISQNRYQFSISDTGIGISQENQDKLFSYFTQADDSITRKYGGTGLGLAICKKLVKLMNGKIWVESNLGFGSKFIFEIYLEKGTDFKQATILSNDVKDTKKELNKPTIDDKIKNELFEKLKDAAGKKRPVICNTVIKEIDEYSLSKEDEEFYSKVKKLILKYQYDKAIKEFL